MAKIFWANRGREKTAFDICARSACEAAKAFRSGGLNALGSDEAQSVAGAIVCVAWRFAATR